MEELELLGQVVRMADQETQELLVILEGMAGPEELDLQVLLDPKVVLEPLDSWAEQEQLDRMVAMGSLVELVPLDPVAQQVPLVLLVQLVLREIVVLWV